MLQLSVLKRYAGIIMVIACCGQISSCRSVRHNDAGFIKRTYHNITARYNGYFNAKKLFDESILSFEQDYIDSYDQLLPVLKIPGEAQGENLAANMGTVIAKASGVVQRHEISRWTDDSYLLIGKANFYSRDFDDALSSLQYVYNTYDDNDIQQEALAWIGLSNLYSERYRDAETAFDIALSNIDSSARAASFVYAAAALYNVERENPHLAVPLLKRASETAPEKESRTRYAYITGQLYERMSRTDSATAWYNRVIGMKPPYEIVFNARLSIARLYNVGGPEGEGIERELREMMEDEKNRDYLDQLYYVLGTIAEKKGDTTGAIENYTLSARTSTVNTNQKGIAYLGIAGIWFRSGDYDKARQYYDSTLTSLSANYPAYEQVVYTSGKLDALARNAEIIAREDSLQRLAMLPASERDAIVEKLLGQELAARAEQEKQAAQALNTGYGRNMSSSLNDRLGDGTWYFYNTTALSQGYSEFLRRWSNRGNEDNWRRANKQSLAGLETGGEAPGGGEEELTAADDPEALREALLADIPLEPAQMDSSRARIISARYESARIYENDLLSPDLAIDGYEQLMELFPANNYTAAVYYSLYKLYRGKNPEASEKYKELVLEQYPDSDYALVINNPGSILAGRGRSDHAMGQLYEETYQLFRQDEFEEVIRRCRDAESERAEPALAAKFALLEALAVGRTDSLPRFTASLERVSAAFPQEEPGRRAQSWLSYVKAHPEEFAGRMPALIEGGSWLTDFDAVQRRMTEKARREAAALARAREEAERSSYFKMPAPAESFVVAIAVSDPGINLNSSRFGLGQLNRRLYGGENYQHQVKTVNNELQLLSVGPFADQASARDYYNTLLQHQGAVIKAPRDRTNIFYLTQSNFDRLINAATVKEYRYYFRVNFLRDASGTAAATLPGRAAPETGRPESADAETRPEDVEPEGVTPETADAEIVAAERAALPEVSETDLSEGEAAAEPDEVGRSASDRPAAESRGRFRPPAEDARYLLVVAVNDATMNLNSTRQGIGLFNRGYFNRMNYKHNSKTINNETQLVSVTIFNSRDEADSYYREFMSRSDRLVDAPAEITDIFLITRENFLLLDSQQIVDEYVNYFKSIYLRADD